MSTTREEHHVTTTPPEQPAQEEELITAREVASLLGITRQRVMALARREGFPAPHTIYVPHRAWPKAKVLEWDAARKAPAPADPSQKAELAAGDEAPK